MPQALSPRTSPQNPTSTKANVIRKYGAYDDASHLARLVDRVRQVGFNSVGAFSGDSPVFEAKGFPRVGFLPLNAWTLGAPVPGVRGVFDPFDAANLAKMDALFAKEVAGNAGDPLLIGYFLDNEQGFEDLPRAIPALPGKHACKRELVRPQRLGPALPRAVKARLNKPATSPSNAEMKMHFTRLMAAMSAACIALSVGCYPAYRPTNYTAAYNQDSKGGYVPQAPVPQGQPPPPRYAGVDPGLVVAGVAAAGLLGYAIGNNHHSYYGPGYYRPVYYGRGYYAPPCYR